MTATTRLNFEVDAAIIARLGEELVARQETALIELIKNAYDADATQVLVTFSRKDGETTLDILDNGSGMDRGQLVEGFLRVAGGNKVDHPRSPKYRRQRAGRKGIGRFATQRLGDKLVLITGTADAETSLKLTIDWRDFGAGRQLHEIDVTLEEVEKGETGTLLRIGALRDQWTDSQIRQAWRGVLGIQQPFPVAPVSDSPDADPGFQVEIRRSGETFGDETLISDIQTEVLDHHHAIFELKVDDEGQASWRITSNRLGEDGDWTLVHHAYRDTPSPPAYDHLRAVAMRAYYFILDPSLLPKLIYSRLRSVLSDEGGIRLYRNGFRVVPYGDPDNDWLGLDAAYSRRSILVPAANRNFFGIIEVTDPDGKLFEEHTSREGLIQNDAVEELRHLASSVLIAGATRLGETRGRKVRAGTRHIVQESPSPLSEVQRAVRSAREAAQAFLLNLQPEAAEKAASEAAVAEQLIQRREQDFDEARALLSDESAMLRFLATLGMTVAEFSHETGMSFDAFRMDFEAVFDAATRSNVGSGLAEQTARARSMLRRLDTLTSYLNSLASARSARSREPQSLRRAVEDFQRGVHEQAKSQGIEIETETPDYDPLLTGPMHSAEIASVLLNLYTNSVKAMRRAGRDRKIKLVADRDESSKWVRLRFLDTGDGIPEKNRERIFDAFFTTASAPSTADRDEAHARGSGLGLWIVAQVADNAGGEVRVEEPEASYSTCIEVLLPAEESRA